MSQHASISHGYYGVRANVRLVIACFALLCSFAAPSRELETTAVGLGSDENAALADALAKAVSQVNGVRSSMNVSTGKVEVVERRSETDEKGRREAQSKLEVGQSADARLQSQGTVSRYEVVSTETAADGRIKLTVKAWISRYEAPTYAAPGSSAGRRRVAVFPASAQARGYDFFGPVGGNELAAQLTSQVEASIMSTGRVSLLDRTTLLSSLAELGLIGSSLTSSAEKAKLRQIRGADLIVLSTLQEARQTVHSWQIRSTGQRRFAEELALEIEVRAVVPATGEVLLIRRVKVNAAASRDAALTIAANEAAVDVVRALTGSAPPMPMQEPIPDYEMLPEEATGPRRSGISLPQDH